MAEEVDAVKEKIKTKMQSRRFIVWIIWTLIFIGIMVPGYISGVGPLQEKALEYYFFITLVYLGVNGWMKKVEADREKKDGE